jgi:hypothetical protein
MGNGMAEVLSAIWKIFLALSTNIKLICTLVCQTCSLFLIYLANFSNGGPQNVKDAIVENVVMQSFFQVLNTTECWPILCCYFKPQNYIL